MRPVAEALPPSRVTSRNALGVVGPLFVFAMLAQSPGRLAPDTKLDLAVAPMRFLSRALHLWQPQAAFGHIQNQADGYLFPMGPFFALGHALGAPMWAVQRLWLAALLTISFWGVVRLADALGIGRPWTRVVAGLAYALSPAMLSVLAYASGGQVPYALAPWILLPLVKGARGGSAPAAAARSGLVVAAMGAVNATSTLGALPLSLLFLLTRATGPRRKQLLRWWLAMVVLGSLWWVLPLVIQAAYGLDFVPFTETARVTTATTSAHEVIRGSGYWLSYLFTIGPWLRAGWTLVSNPVAILASTTLAGAGLAGLADRRLAERTFLVVATVVGAALIVAGYGGSLGDPLSRQVASLLDGPLAPVRNLHKLEPLLRVPLALGLAHVLELAAARLRERGLVRWPLALVTSAALAGTALPVLAGTLVPVHAARSVPAYWESASRWLDARHGHDTTLVVPGAAFGEYTWGRTLDEPLQPLDAGSWAVRDLIPLGSVGMTRVLDVVDGLIGRGQPEPRLAPLLADLGVGYVLARNDLDVGRTGAPPPAVVRQTLATSPGLRLVASFGPRRRQVLPTDHLAPVLTHRGGEPRRAIEVYRVAGVGGPASVHPLASVLRVDGGPDTKLDLTPAASAKATPLPVAPPTVLTGDVGASRLPKGAMGVASDAVRRRDVDFGSLYDNYSYALTTTEKAPGFDRTAHDRLVTSSRRSQATVTMTGAARLSASSYGAAVVRLPERQPYAAFDGVATTAWVSGNPKRSAGEWVELDLAKPMAIPSITISLLRDDPLRPAATKVAIRTDAGTVVRTLRVSSQPQKLKVGVRRTRRLRVTLLRVATFGGGSAGAGLAEVAVPGLSVRRTLSLPSPPPRVTGPEAVVVDRAAAAPYEVGREDEEPRLDRSVALTQPGTYSVSGEVTVRRNQDAVPTLGISNGGVTASSTWHDLPAFRPSAAVDGDPASAWVAAPGDPRPALDVTLPDVRQVSSVRLVPAGGPTQRPTALRIIGSGQARDVELDGDKPATFAAMSSDHLTVIVTATSTRDVPLSAYRPFAAPPVGIAELTLDGVPAPAGPLAAATPIHQDCGHGPAVRIDGAAVPTELSGTMGQGAALGRLSIRSCGQVTLGAGRHHLETDANDPWVVESLHLDPERPAVAPTPSRTVRVVSWQAERRRLRVSKGGASVLAVNENFNRGWAASIKGHRLAGIRLDGWRQGFVLPAGAGGAVDLRFTPGLLYRLSLVLGALALLVVASCVTLQPAGREAAAPAASLPPAGVLVLALVAALLMGGPLVALVAVLVLLPRARPVMPLVAASAFVTSGVVVAIQAPRFPASHLGAFSPEVQLLSVLAILAVTLSLLRPRRPAAREPDHG